MQKLSGNARAFYRMMHVKAPTLEELNDPSWPAKKRERLKPTFSQKKAMVKLAGALMAPIEGR